MFSVDSKTRFLWLEGNSPKTRLNVRHTLPHDPRPTPYESIKHASRTLMELIGEQNPSLLFADV